MKQFALRWGGFLALIAVGVVLYMHFKASESRTEPVGSGLVLEAEGIPETGGVGSEGIVPLSSGGEVHRHQGVRAVGRISLHEIPSGELKDRLVKLTPEALDTALNTLSKMNFHANDLDSVRVNQAGGVYFVCSFSRNGVRSSAEFMPFVEESQTAVAMSEWSGASVPISEPPLRHSKPGASNVLFLDFNGHVVAGTVWNDDIDFGNVSSWDCQAWSLDGDRTTFSAIEQSNIVQIWERVSEDFAPFDVDVTTEQPASWNRNTGHALITPNTDKNGLHCPHYGYGGIAYVDVFGEREYSYNVSRGYSPAWCIDYALADVAEVISHEFGHNLGLSHDLRNQDEGYYAGHENGLIAWGPIMGTGYGNEVSQWTKGEYYDSAESQDDLEIISKKVGYRTDDHGDTMAAASVLTVVEAGVVEDSGIIEQTDDPDVFSFVAGFGEVTIHANAYKASSSTWGANLDIRLALYDASGTLLATNNPVSDIDASIAVTVSGGQYYLYVIPTGVGNPMSNTPTGYTSYGSLGQYWLSGTVSSDSDNDLMPDEWEFQYFGNVTSALATADFDQDGVDNLTEYITGYDPTNASSYFSMTSYELPETVGDPVVIHWPTQSGRLYSVSSTHNLKYIDFTPLSDANDLPHTQNSYTDTVTYAQSSRFYRIEVRLEE
ncbi:MAG: zinc-dependent metalloprotease family protein [Pontiella sp.]